MANADGSVIFSCDLDSTKAQKKLSKLRDKISELNSELEKETGNKLNLEKQLDAASQAAKATEERVKALRKEVERLNDREWIQKQGFTQSEYQAQVLDRRAAAEAELKQQEELLHTQTKEVKTLSAAYEETTANIDSMTVKLDKAKVAAGELIANTEQERREREAENSALAKAGPVCRAFQRSGQEFSALYACILSHHGGAHGAAQADQGGYCDQRRGIRRFCPPQRRAADAGRAFDGRTHSGADVANESACGHCVGDRDDYFDSER